MLVPGAIAATSAASTMMHPADAARAPRGATNTITGARAFISRWMISRIEESRPPGVSSWRTNAAEFRASASEMPRAIYSALAALMDPEYVRTMTFAGVAAPTKGASKRVAPRRTIARREGFMLRAGCRAVYTRQASPLQAEHPACSGD